MIPGSSRRLGSDSTFFLNTGFLAGQSSQIVQVRSSHFTATNNLDLLDARREEQECSFHAYPVRGNSANGEVAVRAALSDSDNNALEDLGSLATALDNLRADFDGIARAELLNLLVRSQLLNRVQIHSAPPFLLARNIKNGRSNS